MQPQPYLSKSGLAYFEAIKNHLEQHDAMEDIDSYIISRMSHWLDLFERAAEQVDGDGGVQITPNGYTQVTGYLTVMKTAEAIFDKLSAKLGLSPKDRELIKQFGTKRKEKDQLDEL